jgi:hypothetical protein
MYNFEDMIYSLQSWGVMDVILPFVLIFTIVFAVLEKTKILGESDAKVRKYAVVIAMVVAFSVIVPHVMGTYPYGKSPVDVINNSLPQVGLLLVSIVMMLLTVGLWTGKRPNGSKGIGTWFIGLSILTVILIFTGALGWVNVPDWTYRLIHSDAMPLVIAIIVFGIIISFIVGDDKGADGKPKESSMAKLMKNIGDFADSGSGGDKKP